MQVTVTFAPQSQKQVRALLKHLNSASVYAAVATARTSPAYTAAVACVRATMRAHFAVNPPQKRVKECPWQTLGTYAICQQIAQEHNVPAWDVVGDANPY